MLSARTDQSLSTDLEAWLPIEGWEGVYAISNRGRVRSIGRTVLRRDGTLLPLRDRILSPAFVNDYPTVSLRRPGEVKRATVHLLVLKAFKGGRPFKGAECRHLDGNRKNARLDNLTYGTPKENQIDRVAHGTSNRGERCGTAKLTEREVLEIRRDRRTNTELAALYGVSWAAIYAIRMRLRWAWLEEAA